MNNDPQPSISRSEDTVRRLRSDIFLGAFAPGTLLAEASVARQMGVSRVPVREALFALEREGLVEFSPTGRAYVKELTPHDFEELFVLRLALEPPGARLAAPRIRTEFRALEANIEATVIARSLPEVTHLDLDFHQIILDASGQKRLARLWGSLRSELELWLERMHQTHEFQTQGTREKTVESHRELLICFKEQSPEEAERHMQLHIQGWRAWLPMASEAREI